MARKYNFSITNGYGECLQVEGCDSFDEAIKIVERAVQERDVQLEERMRAALPPAPVPPVNTAPVVGARPDVVIPINPGDVPPIA